MKKKRNKQDATLININALKKRVSELEECVDENALVLLGLMQLLKELGTTLSKMQVLVNGKACSKK